MVKQKSGCVVSITAALADRPIAGENSSISMITKGGLNSATQNLAVEYATVKDIVDAVLYLVQAGHVSGEILHVDGAAPARRW
jgi:hypothetical protein